MIETFVVLLFAHVVGDFVLQTGWMVRDKHRPPVLAAHVGVILACSIVATGSLSPALFLIALAHAGIDAIKTGFRLTGLGWFLGDQAAHVVTLALAVLVWPGIWASGLWMRILPPEVTVWLPVVALHLAGILLATRAGIFVIATLLVPFRDGAAPDAAGLPGGGTMIGLLERGLTYLFISHDLHVVRALCHQLMVLQNGEVVEQGDCEQIFNAPQQAYTRELLAASDAFDTPVV